MEHYSLERLLWQNNGAFVLISASGLQRDPGSYHKGFDNLTRLHISSVSLKIPEGLQIFFCTYPFYPPLKVPSDFMVKKRQNPFNGIIACMWTFCHVLPQSNNSFR